MEALGGEIRQVRETAGLSQKMLGDALECTQGKINKLEDGSNRVKLPELEKIIEACKVGDAHAEDLRKQAYRIEELPNSMAQPSVPSWFQKFAVLEPAATEVFSWHTERLPGLLQTEHYMHKQFSAAGVGGGELARHWRARRSRKEIFELEQPPRYRFVLGESCLYRTPDGFSPFVVWDEAQYLAEIADRYPGVVTVQVLPFTARIPFAPTDFTIMNFASGQKRDYIYIEHPAGGTEIKSEGDIQHFHVARQRLIDAALGVDESREFLNKVVKQAREMSESDAAEDYRRHTAPLMLNSFGATSRQEGPAK
jgi:transcriptional regulator with XRE-family HTH domain